MIVADRPIPLAVSKRPSSHFRSDSRPSGRVNSQLPCSQAIPVHPPRQNSCLPRTHFAKGCKNTKRATLTTFRINTCKSVSKQRTLTPFRINTYRKTGEGGTLPPDLPSSRLSDFPAFRPSDHQAY